MSMSVQSRPDREKADAKLLICYWASGSPSEMSVSSKPALWFENLVGWGGVGCKHTITCDSWNFVKGNSGCYYCHGRVGLMVSF